MAFLIDLKMSNHVNIPIFIPHLGCPNNCVFCNQRAISGVYEFNSEKFNSIIQESLSTISSDTEVEIAFFGGSFTGIERDLMISLLDTAYSYVLNGQVKSIRCSTRPDYISEEILHILKRYGVTTIELGLQSTSDYVLELSKRGHNFDDEVNACEMIVRHGFDLIGQMMIGLPGSCLESELKTAEFIASCGAVGSRIYPTVVFNDTELCEMARAGEYTPLSFEDAVVRSARVLDVFIKNGIEVIRIGLCASDNLISDKTYFAGPNHPALGEYIIGEYYYENILNSHLGDEKGDKILHVAVSKGSLSKAIGQRRRNKHRLMNELGYADVIFSESQELSGYELITMEERKSQCT